MNVQKPASPTARKRVGNPWVFKAASIGEVHTPVVGVLVRQAMHGFCPKDQGNGADGRLAHRAWLQCGDWSYGTLGSACGLSGRGRWGKSRATTECAL